MNKNNKLPLDWELTEIKNISEVNPRSDKSVIRDNLEVSFVPMPAVSAGNGFIDVTQNRPFSEVKKGYTGFLEGDVLFAKITPCMENGKMAVVPKLINGYGFGSTEFHVLRPKQVEAKYLYFFVSTEVFRRNAAHHMTGAVGQKRVPTVYIKECKIPVAPPNEQKRIVAEIEKQFSRLDEAVDNLKRVKSNLKRYKASILKAAVEGKLTEEWREKHPDVEPTDKLLERILADRRKKWEKAELAKMKANGKKPKDDKWKKKYKEPPQVDENLLPALPIGWVWATISQISSDTQIGLVRSKAEQNMNGKGVGYIKMNNVTMDGRVIANNLVFVNADENEKERFSITVGDILFNTRNSLELVGKVGLVKRNISDHIFNNNLMRIRVPDGVNSAFIVFQMCSTQFRKKMERVKRATTNIAAIYAKDLMPLSIVLPPSDEQIEISKEIEQHYSIVEEIETSLEANIQRADRLRQSVLKKAFSGKLGSENKSQDN